MAQQLSPRQKNLEARNQRLKTRFEELYNIKRKRIDDVIRQLQEEFYIEERTVRKILTKV